MTARNRSRARRDRPRVRRRGHRLRARLHVEPSSDPPQPEHGRPAEGPHADGQRRSSTTARRCAIPFLERSPIDGLKEDAAFLTGKSADGKFVATNPRPVDDAMLERGRLRYTIYCQPCHDARGDGKGILFQRGNVPTATYHQNKILNYPDGQIFDVITNGVGLMQGYRWPIPAADRWAIMAYVRRTRERSAGTHGRNGLRRHAAPRSSSGGAACRGASAGDPARLRAGSRGRANGHQMRVSL